MICTHIEIIKLLNFQYLGSAEFFLLVGIFSYVVLLVFRNTFFNYSSVENSVVLCVWRKQAIIAERTFSLLDIPPTFFCCIQY